jgi:hypothetical protein
VNPKAHEAGGNKPPVDVNAKPAREIFALLVAIMAVTISEDSPLAIREWLWLFIENTSEAKA